MATIEEKVLLAMPTIEDRAKYIFDNTEKQGVTDCWGNDAWRFSKCGALYAIEGAMKIQDRIARQEERERCIKAAQDYYCNRTCAGYDIEHCLCRICDCRKNLRKAIKKGGNQ